MPYELIVMPFPPRVRHKGFHAVNPLGTVPAFFDGEHLMTESSAICQYIAARYAADTLAVAVDDPAYAEYLNFMHMGEATLTFPQTIFFRYSALEAPEKRQPVVANDYRLWFASRLKNAATMFSGKSYVCGDRFTAADISFGYALGFATHLKLAEHFPETISDYWTRLKARNGYQRAREKEIEASRDQEVEIIEVNYQFEIAIRKIEQFKVAEEELKGDLAALVRSTPENIAIKPIYTASDLIGIALLDSQPGCDLSLWTTVTMYAGWPCTIRDYTGFSTAEASNAFYRAALASGQKGLSVAFDLATHRGMTRITLASAV